MPEYEGIPGTNPTPTGVIFVPENIPHYYKRTQPDSPENVLQVCSVRGDFHGNIPASDPAPENQAPGYFRSTFNPANTNVPDYVKVEFPPSPFSPGWTDNPKTNAAARWVASLDANGDPVYGTPPATASGDELAMAAAISVMAAELSARLAAK